MANLNIKQEAFDLFCEAAMDRLRKEIQLFTGDDEETRIAIMWNIAEMTLVDALRRSNADGGSSQEKAYLEKFIERMRQHRKAFGYPELEGVTLPSDTVD